MVSLQFIISSPEYEHDMMCDLLIFREGNPIHSMDDVSFPHVTLSRQLLFLEVLRGERPVEELSGGRDLLGAAAAAGCPHLKWLGNVTIMLE